MEDGFSKKPPNLKEGERLSVFVYDEEKNKKRLGCGIFMRVDSVKKNN